MPDSSPHVAELCDANGNLTSDGSNSYIYDPENRLVSVTGGHTANLVYDPLGRLQQIDNGAGTTTRFVYDGDALVDEYNGSGALTQRYVHGTNAAADDPLVWYSGGVVSSATRHFLRADHEGSIIALTNPSGAPTINSYDEYGIPGSANTGRFQYTGQAWLSEVGMYYYKARIYSPTLGRFLQTDPIGYKDQINLYEYVGDDPLNKLDPLGTHQAPIIVQLPNGNTIIYIPVQLKGGTEAARSTALSSAQAKASQIHSTDGKTSVIIENAKSVGAKSPVTFDISPGKQSGMNAQGEGINTATLQGHLNGSRSDLGSEIVHDGIHPFGVKDEYTYKKDKNGNFVRDSSGELEAVPTSPAMKDNIMGPNMGNQFESNQLNDNPALRNPQVSTCKAKDNSGGGCS